MNRILAGKRILSRILCPNCRPFCSSAQNNKPSSTTTGGGGGGGDGPASSSQSWSTYNQQLKDLENLDLEKAMKIMLSGPPRRKKGLDYHLVKLFFCCLPSLAVYLVAQYARSEMRKMDEELEKKKQAEFEAQAKEMELKAAKERAAVASHPDILEVKERLHKLEMILKDVVKSTTQVDNATKTRVEDQIKQNGAATAEQGNTPSVFAGKPPIERGTAPSEEKTSGLVPDIHASQSNQKDSKS